MTRLIFVNRFYWPEEPATGQLLTDLAESLAAQGWPVTVVTSHPGAAHVPRIETRRNVRIERVRGTRWAGVGLIGKAVDFASFYLGALLRVLRCADKNAIVIAKTDPPMLGVGAWLTARLRGAAVVHWVQDIYPEIAIELSGHRSLAVFRPLRNASWRRADHCVTLGSDMAAVLAENGAPPEKCSVIPNWAPSGLSAQPNSAGDALRAEWGLAGKFVVAYSGNLGRVHDLEPVLDLAEELRPDAGVVFAFIGRGAQRAALEAGAARRGLSNVRFFPPQPRDRLAESLAVGDIHLVTLRPGCERLVFPSKLYGVAAVGRPVVFIGPAGCDVARQVAENRLGYAATPGNVRELATAIRRLADDPHASTEFSSAARRFAAEHRAEAAIARWSALLERLRACDDPALRRKTVPTR